ncbi:partial arthrofactin-type cyclic lipopeptide synthetase A, partial [Burkholderiaceae bacterium]
MIVSELLSRLEEQGITLSLADAGLVARGEDRALDDPELIEELRAHKAALVELIRSGSYARPQGGEVRVPTNLIGPDCERITPQLLPLVTLSQAEIDGIVAGVPGGAPNVQDIYPLAPLQEGILFHHLMADAGDAYLTPALLAFDSRQHLDGFVQALQTVIDRHDILRTGVCWEGLAEPVQVVWRHAELQLQLHSFDTDDDVAQQLRERFDPRHHRIDVRRAPLMRAHAAHDAAGKRWLLLLLNHHLCGDHTTQDVMLREIHAQLAGRAHELPAPQPFRNFVAQARLGLPAQAHERFFRELLHDVREPTAPFGFHALSRDAGHALSEARQPVDPALARRLRALARSLRLSAASLCHLAWAQVLARVSGRDDVVFGTLMFGRMQGGDGADQVMGLFINTLPVRLHIDGRSVREAVRHTQSLLVQLMRHEHAPLALAQRCSGVAAPAPLFTALLNYRHSSMAAAATDPLADAAWAGIRLLETGERTDYPVVMNVEDLGEQLWLTTQVAAPIDAAQVGAMMETALAALVHALEQAPDTPLRELDVLPEPLRRRLLGSRDADADLPPGGGLVHRRFERQAARRPDATALIQAGHALSYRELNARANRLARHLRALGVRPDERVALCMERSIELVVAMLAVLKAGGAYMPLDAGYPAERLAYMLDDGAPVAVLTHAAARAALGAAPRASLIDLDADAERWAGLPAHDLDAAESNVHDGHLAYVIYTSGSTGRPKAAQVLHRGLGNLIDWYVDDLGLDRGDAVLLLTSHSFDLTQKNFFGPLSVGGALHLADEPFDPRAIVAQVQREGITQINLAPSAFHALIDANDANQLAGLRRVVLGGEPIQLHRLRELPAPRPQFVNSYGPTECSDVVGYHCLDPLLDPAAGSVPLGRAIRGLRLYLLDDRLRPVPPGVPGEIHVGGVGVGRGYLNRPQLTAERFIDDPFSGEPGARMYRTGDLGRWLPGGDIEFLGRNDFQVKIRGFRVELGEIEQRLLQHPGVREAVVLAQPFGGDQRLVAYCVPHAAAPAADELRSHAAATLPQHMVPAAYVMLQALPLNPNGKLDRAALPEPDAQAVVSRGHEPPRDGVEAALAAIWCEVLGLPGVGRHDDFFELGGHSLLAVRMIERMRRAGLHADVRTLFATPTLAALARAVDAPTRVTFAVPANGIPAGSDTITPEMLTLLQLSQDEIHRVLACVPGGASNVQDIYPLAPLQEGILFHHLMERSGDVYLTPALFAFDTRQRLDGFLAAMQAVVDRHDVLRTAVLWEGLREPLQVVWRHAPLAVQEVALDATGDAAQQLREQHDPRRFRIDVRSAPLIRVFIAHDAARGRWLALQLFHHLASDHTTLELMQREIEAHLTGRAQTLPPPLPFRDFVAHARHGVASGEHEAFFRTMLADVDEPTLPYGLRDVRGDGSDIVELKQPVDPALSRRLRDCARSLGVSAASIHHLAWSLVLARLACRDDVVFGTLLIGRMQGGRGADEVMGLFLNTLPLRVRLHGQGVRAGVRAMHDSLTGLLRHEHAPLALAQRCSGVAAPQPLFNALLNYRHSAVPDGAALDDTLKAWEGIEFVGGEERTNYPLGLCVDDCGDDFGLTAQVHHSVDAALLCELMQAALARLVDALERAPATPLCSLELLPPARRAALLALGTGPAASGWGERCLHELVQAQAERTPDAVALVQDDRELRYGELNTRANRLARHLRSLGVRPEQRVAVCMQRSPDMVIALLAVLKAGGAYVPLDAEQPAARLAALCDDAAPLVVLTHAEAADAARAAAGARQVIDVQADEARWRECPAHDLGRDESGVTPSSAAYVVYTSGSTGQPKGVLVEHRQLCNEVAVLREQHALGEHDRLLQFVSVAFDVCAEEVFTSLASGATLVLRTLKWLGTAGSFWSLCESQRISAMNLPAQFWEQLVLQAPQAAIPASLKRIVVGGEAMSAPALRAWFARPGHRPRLFNAYGPSETAVCVTLHECSDAAPPPIGRPLANLRLYVLDAEGRLVPPGVAGELCIGGAQVARGYLQRPELTAQRFVGDPFAEAGARMYRSGDLARWRADG